MAQPRIGVHSGTVMTVLGPIPVEAMGVTLMHEHILLDASSWWKRPCCGSRDRDRRAAARRRDASASCG